MGCHDNHHATWMNGFVWGLFAAILASWLVTP